MELLNEEEFNKYVKSNFNKVDEIEKYEDYRGEMDGFCDSCQKDVFFKVHSRKFQPLNFNRDDLPIFITYFVQCPKCKRRSFIQFVLLNITNTVIDSDGDEDYTMTYELYRLYTLPTREESYINKDIPENHLTLKATIAEAMFSLNHGKYVSSAIMFRRGLQIIAKDILGAKGKTLYNQLEWLKQNKNLLSIDLSILFHDNSKLIKDVGNQGAHLDDDESLHNFTQNDVNTLHDLFLLIINEIFIKPEQLKKIQNDLIENRKLKL